MIVLDEAWRIDQICFANGVENIVDGDACREEARRFGCYLELWYAAPLHEHGSETIEAIYARLDIIGCNFPEFALRDGVRGQAIYNNGKGCKG